MTKKLPLILITTILAFFSSVFISLPSSKMINSVRLIVNVNQRLIDSGTWAGTIEKGKRIVITKLVKGTLKPYGKYRWWAVNGEFEHRVGCPGTYRSIKVLLPITSRAGYILNIDDSNQVLPKLGLETPNLPDSAIKCTYTPYCWDDRRLLVRNENGEVIDKISPFQDFYLLETQFGKFNWNGLRKWGRIYSLYKGESWVALTDGWVTAKEFYTEWPD